MTDITPPTETDITIPTLEEYREAVRKFLADSADWAGLEPYTFYTTGHYRYDWAETCDNAHGGLDLSWAFYATRDQGGTGAGPGRPGIYAPLDPMTYDRIAQKYAELVDELKNLLAEDEAHR